MRSLTIWTLGMFTLALVAIGCETAPTDTDENAIEFDEFRPDLADGYLLVDHVEVSPGVFMVPEVIDYAGIEFRPWEELGLSPDDLDDLALDDDTRAEARAKICGTCDSSKPQPKPLCSRSAIDNYGDTTVEGSVFGMDPVWKAQLNVFSITRQMGGLTMDVDGVVVDMTSLLPDDIGHVASHGYLYINGDYVGFIANQAFDGPEARALGLFSAQPDSAGQLSAYMLTDHRMNDAGGRAGMRILSRVGAKVHACR